MCLSCQVLEVPGRRKAEELRSQQRRQPLAESSAKQLEAEVAAGRERSRAARQARQSRLEELHKELQLQEAPGANTYSIYSI